MTRAILFLLAIIMVVPAFAKEPIRTLTGTVTRVIDGDTVRVAESGSQIKVRLFGIDAPETEKTDRTGRVSKPSQPYGLDAWRVLQGKVLGKTVRVDIMDVDRYRRYVGILWLDGRDVNEELVAEGYAWAYRRYLDRPHASEYLRAEEEARRRSLGLWQQHNPEPPWNFRRRIRLSE